LNIGSRGLGGGETSELDLGSLAWDPSDKLTEFPPEILRLRHLTKLILSNHRLKSLPPEIGELENLEELDLARNEELALPSGFPNCAT
jgi:Leucine-rich repeat (LRR) protein